jgi:hypothetical protein
LVEGVSALEDQQMRATTALTIAAFTAVALTAGQIPAGAQSASGVGPVTGGSAAAGGSFTVQSVDPVMPFGSINIAAAGANNASISSFAGDLSAAQKSELSGRCAVINDTANAARYPDNAKTFCRAYLTAAVSAPSTGAGIGAGAGASSSAGVPSASGEPGAPGVPGVPKSD